MQGLERKRYLVISRKAEQPKGVDRLSEAAAGPGTKEVQEEALQMHRWCMVSFNMRAASASIRTEVFPRYTNVSLNPCHLQNYNGFPLSCEVLKSTKIIKS